METIRKCMILLCATQFGQIVIKIVTSCHIMGNGTLVATIGVRAKELSKVISNNIV